MAASAIFRILKDMISMDHRIPCLALMLWFGKKCSRIMVAGLASLVFSQDKRKSHTTAVVELPGNLQLVLDCQ